jgi:hypothetical protein
MSAAMSLPKCAEWYAVVRRAWSGLAATPVVTTLFMLPSNADREFTTSPSLRPLRPVTGLTWRELGGLRGAAIRPLPDQAPQQILRIESSEAPGLI